MGPLTGKRRLLRSRVNWHTWPADSRTIYGVRLTPTEPMAIIAIPIDGGPTRTLAWADKPLTQLPRYGIAVHGSRLYFPLVERRGDVWVGEVERP
jgi:hypothetical protein